MIRRAVIKESGYIEPKEPFVISGDNLSYPALVAQDLVEMTEHIPEVESMSKELSDAMNFYNDRKKNFHTDTMLDLKELAFKITDILRDLGEDEAADTAEDIGNSITIG